MLNLRCDAVEHNLQITYFSFTEDRKICDITDLRISYPKIFTFRDIMQELIAHPISLIIHKQPNSSASLLLSHSEGHNAGYNPYKTNFYR